MTRGRKKKPTLMRLLEGNPSRKAINTHEPICDLPPVKPFNVAACESASREWDRVIAAMPPGIYTALDVAALAGYALAWALLEKAQRELDADGLILHTPRGSKPHPAIRVWKMASENLLKCADRLGLSPVARPKLQVPQRFDEANGRWAGLLGHRAS